MSLFPEYPLRPGLPPLPERMRKLPVNKKGYPVPWFVARVGDDWDFRVIDPRRFEAALKFHRCWLCGQAMGRFSAFVIGPMCLINRTSAEPPSHLQCAEFAVRACPFILLPNSKRRDAGLPEQRVSPGGEMLPHNPGVTLIYITQGYGIRSLPNGPVLAMGEPTEVRCYREERAATRQEVIAAMDTGLEHLRAVATKAGPATISILDIMHARAMQYLPEE